MNKPDKAGEPSMEEILASIRQIIADEPGMDRSAAGAAPNPLAPRTPGADRDRPGPVAREARSQPLLDRLNGVLKSPQPPTNPFGSKRPVPFDQDLADMLDDAGAADVAMNPAPKPADIRVMPELVTPAANKSPSFPSPSPSPSAGAAKPVLDGAASMPPQLAPTSSPPASDSSEPPSPFGAAEVEPPPPPPPRTFGFPPLRKQGFYPPQSATPPRRPPQAQEPVLQDGAAATPEPIRPPQPSPAPSMFGASPLSSLSSTRFPGAEARAPQADAGFAPAAPPPSPEPVAAAPVDDADDLPLVQAVAASRAAEAKPVVESPAPAPVPPVYDTPVDVRPLAGQPGLGPETFGASGPRFAAGPDNTVAAAQALDALAQGLAASAAASAFSGAGGPPPSAQPAAAAVSPPEAEAQPMPFAAPVALTPSAAPPRTLEDAVAEMLRPMLQQWVADNMPRIIERALRAEAGRGRPGSN